jgi:uncharacterized protein YbjT (DUF2867 family)
MNVLLTGASGFVGSNIAKVLTDRHGDAVIDTRTDMTDADAVATHMRSAVSTSERLGTPLLSVAEILEAFRIERSTGALA